MAYKQYSSRSCNILGILQFYSNFIWLRLCICFLCIVVCMHNFHSAHIIVCTCTIIYNKVNALAVLNFDIYHIVLILCMVH